jgi:hypothetical protein
MHALTQVDCGGELNILLCNQEEAKEDFLLHRQNLDAFQPSGSRDPAFSAGLLTLFTRPGAVKTHLTRNRQLLTRVPEGVPLQKPAVPNL